MPESSKIADILIGAFAVVVGIYYSLGIWFEQFRPQWKGTRRACGPVGCAGCALFLISLGLAFLLKNAISKTYLMLIVICIPCGFILGNIGAALDARAHYGNVSEPSIASNEKLNWIFVFFGVIFLIVIILLWFFNRG
jgi:hypothetical protein